VAQIIPLNNTSETELLTIAAAVESRSMHSLAQAVVRLAQQRNLNLPEAGELQSVTGKVVISTVNGKQVKIGNLKLFSESNSSAIPEVIAEQVRALEAEGKSTMLVMMNNRLLGILRLSDQPRAEAVEIGIKKKSCSPASTSASPRPSPKKPAATNSALA
jgi:Cd2+/Zn2+-exporting ATPase